MTGAEIKAARKAAGLSQGQLATRLSALLCRPVKQPEISRWEADGVKATAATAVLIRQALEGRLA